MRNGDLTCTTHGHELRRGKARGGYKVEGDRGEKRNGTTPIA